MVTRETLNYIKSMDTLRFQKIYGNGNSIVAKRQKDGSYNFDVYKNYQLKVSENMRPTTEKQICIICEFLNLLNF